jgi:hypothetical protein
MARDETLRRLRLVLLGYLIIAATLVVGLAVDYAQTQDIRDTQQNLISDTEQLARAIANGQTYLCDQIAVLSGEALLRGHQTIQVHCFSQEQRYRQIISRLSAHQGGP